MAVVADSGVAGGTLCTMESVLNESCPMVAGVLYTPKIDKGAVIGSISTLKQDIDSNRSSAEALISDINGVLSASNSNRFYRGTTATTQLATLDDITNDITTLLGVLSNIDVSKIGNAVDRYNAKLAKLKRDTRKKLAYEAAQAINGKVISSECLSASCSLDWTPPERIEHCGDKIHAYHYYNYVMTDKNDDYALADYSYTKDYIVAIQYTRFSILDLEAAITSVGGSLPYNVGAIVDYEE